MIALITFCSFVISVRCLELDTSRDLADDLENARMEICELESKISQLNQRMLEYHDKCSVKYGDSCFFAIFVGNGKVNQNAANLLCEKKGAQAGNIYSSIHYNQIMDYLRPWIDTRLDSDTGIKIRTGMTFDPKSQIVYLSDGSQAEYVSWRKNQPSALTTVRLSVYPYGSENNGMVIGDPSDGNFGVLCQIQI